MSTPAPSTEDSALATQTGAFPESTREAHRRVLAISFPAILANSSAPLVGLVDTWAVGHLPGAVHLAAVGLGGVIFSYLFWAFGFLRMGTTGLVAQAWGRGDSAELARVVLRASALSVMIGLAMLIGQSALLELSLWAMAPPPDVALITAEYFAWRIWAAPATLLVFAISGVLFGLGRTWAVLLLQLILNISNGALNLLFVIGFEMGVPGVALGTLIAQWISAAVGMVILLNTPGIPRLMPYLRSRSTWLIGSFKPLVVINGFIFLRTILLMTALALIMRESAELGETAMAASHVVNQYLMLIALGLDGFAHAAEALAGAAWGHGKKEAFRRWVRIAGFWAFIASLLYALFFALAGTALTAMLTNISEVRSATALLMPLIIALPLISVWCYHFDGVFIGATAGAAMLVTMAIAFAVYWWVLDPWSTRWGLTGVWAAVCLFMGLRGITQALWYPRLLRRLQ